MQPSPRCKGVPMARALPIISELRVRKNCGRIGVGDKEGVAEPWALGNKQLRRVCWCFSTFPRFAFSRRPHHRRTHGRVPIGTAPPRSLRDARGIFCDAVHKTEESPFSNGSLASQQTKISIADDLKLTGSVRTERRGGRSEAPGKGQKKAAALMGHAAFKARDSRPPRPRGSDRMGAINIIQEASQ